MNIVFVIIACIVVIALLPVVLKIAIQVIWSIVETPYRLAMIVIYSARLRGDLRLRDHRLVGSTAVQNCWLVSPLSPTPSEMSQSFEPASSIRGLSIATKSGAGA